MPSTRSHNRQTWSRARRTTRSAKSVDPATYPTLWDRGYRFCFAEIEIEDSNVQGSFRLLLWQDADLAPEFPNLVAFLNDWRTRNPGSIHSVKVATFDLIQPEMLEAMGGSIAVH
jgi:uncharacterized protein Usg